MSPISIKLKKYGQVTRVTIDGKHAYDTAVVPKYEKEHIESLLAALYIENVLVEYDEKS